MISVDSDLLHPASYKPIESGVRNDENCSRVSIISIKGLDEEETKYPT